MSKSVSNQRQRVDNEHNFLVQCPKCGFHIPETITRCWKCGKILNA